MGFKDLYGVGGAGGVAGGDVEFFTGVIQSWDEATGANTVLVNNKAISNLNVIQSGIGLQYQPGDVVDVRRVQTVYTVLGKVAAPGANLASKVKSAVTSPLQSTTSTSYTDLATFGPEVTTYISSARSCLVNISVTVSSAGNPVNQYIGGSAALQVSGASTITAGTWHATHNQLSRDATSGAGFLNVPSRWVYLTAADGLNQGTNTFTVKYRSINAGVACFFADRVITVIPL